MPLKSGTHLGAYEVIALIGEGGMGQVYRAHDTKLDRDVALKVLPETFSSDPDRLARFQREAKVLASLNHPNIAGIYGLEEDHGIRALVLEFVEGPTLADRIAQGAIPADEAIPIAKQIAEALEAAHEAGVIHRDLKPANIKLRPDGVVKVLDFGLAKALNRDVTSPSATEGTTVMTPAVTGAEVILGTVAYMAPEQAKGRSLDRRADVWAFGAILYEMLTQRRAFEGDHISETLVAVLRAEPNWTALPSETPSAARRLLWRCLQKDQRSRLSDMAMVRIELADAEAEARAGTAVPQSLVAPRRSVLPSVAPYAAALLLALVTGLVTWLLNRPAAESRPVVRFAIEQQGQFSATGRETVALSPDGTRLVYVANGRLYVRNLSEPAARAIEGTDAGGAGSARDVFFSPDGRWIGFWQQGQLKKVATDGGALMAIGDLAIPFGISWGLDNKILLGGRGIWQQSADGGKAEQLVNLGIGSLAERPQMLPGGTWMLFTLIPAGATSFDEGQVVVQSRTSGERRVIVKGARDALYLAPGYLVFGRGNTLLAQAFDVNRLTVAGSAVSLVDDVANGGAATPIMHFAVSATGAMVYVPSTETTVGTRLVQVARDGTRSSVVDVPGVAWNPRFSPDGSRLAYGLTGFVTKVDPSDLWVMDVQRGARTRVTFAGNNRFYPIWTRDGTRLTFSDGIGSSSRLVTARADGTGAVQTLLDDGQPHFPTSYSADGRTLAIYLNGKDRTRDIWMLPTDSAKKTPVPFITTPFEEQAAIFSPDGHWIAYVSNKSGKNDVYARPYPGPGEEITISVGGGGEPVWAPSGRELFYRREKKMMGVPVEASAASLKIGTPRVLFEDPYMVMLDVPASGGVANYDISPDGRHFVMVELSGLTARGTDTVRLQMVLNWLEELRQRVPRH